MPVQGSILVQDALFRARALGQGQRLKDSDAQMALRALNRMLDSLSNVNEFIFTLAEDSFVMTPNVASYPTTLLLVMGRPVSIASITVRLDNIDWQVELVDSELFDSIPYKITTSVPEVCYYDRAYPIGMLNFFPLPYAAFECKVTARNPLSAPITMTTTVDMPPGYEKALVDNLGVDICSSFGLDVPAQLKEDAIKSKAILMRTNFKSGVMDTGLTRQVPADAFIYKGF